MNKKKILFVIESLACAGAERSLITLLSLIDYSKFDVSLQLLQYGGELQKFLPHELHLLPQFQFVSILNMSLKRHIIYSFRKCRFSLLYDRIKYSYAIRKSKQTAISTSRIYWQHFAHYIAKDSMMYDTAIGYAQGFPTFYVVDKISAKKKYAWINVTHHLSGIEKTFQKSYYQVINSIVCVSNITKELFQQENPEYKNKLYVIMDIMSEEIIQKQANIISNPFHDDCSGNRIITVARLSAGQKGMDITLNVCKILHDRKINFKWYILGEGGFRQEMEQFIVDNDLKDFLVLMGTKNNPYPYIKNSDLYVQTSRFEGYGLSIAEARLLNVPVVTTEYEGVYVQMKPDRNGIVVPIDATAVADAIQDLLAHPEKRAAISGYQRQEKKGNVEEIQKFYRMIEEYD